MALNLDQANGGNFVLTKAGLAIGSTTSQLATGASATYVIDGIFRTAKAATASFALAAPSGYSYTAIPIGSKASFGVWLDTAGTFTVTQGPVTVVNSNSDRVAPPPNPDGRALVGVATVYVGPTAAGAFTPGTTAFNATGVTTTYFDTFSLPASGF